MVLSASDQALIDQIAQGLQGASNIPWSTLLGMTTLSTPQAGVATLDAEKAAGLMTNSPYAGQPTEATQEAGGYFGPQMGYLSNSPTAAQANQAGFVTLPSTDNLGNAVTTTQLPTLATQTALGTIAPDQATIRRIMGLAPNWGPGIQIPLETALASPGYQNWVAMQRATNPNFNPNDPFGGMGSATLENEENFAQQFGRAGDYTNGVNPNGPYTLAAQEATGYIGGNGLGENGGGAATTTEQQLQQQGGLGVLNLLSQLSGPANAFQQQAVLNGLDSTGLSKAVGSIQGKYGLPTFQAPQAAPQAQTLQSLMNQVNAGTNTPGLGTGWSGSTGGSSTPVYAGGSAGGPLVATRNADGSYSVPTNSAGAPSTVDSGTAAYLNALPAPNKINARNFYNLDPDSQKFLLSAYGAAGYSPSSVLNTTEKLLPQFKAPAAGTIAA